MFKFSIRKLTIIIVITIIFISAGLSLIKYFNIQKKQVNSNFVLKTVNLAPIDTIDAQKIVTSQYKSNYRRD